MAQRDCRKGCKCRPGRPNCRRSRALWDKPCRCDGYHFPHRIGSALCHFDNRGNARHFHQAMNTLAYGTG